MNKQKHSGISCTIQKFPPDICDDDWTKKRKIKWETQFEHVEVKNFCGNCQSFYLDLVRNDAKVPLFTSIEYGGNLVCWNFSCNLSEPCFFCSTCLSCEKKKTVSFKRKRRKTISWMKRETDVIFKRIPLFWTWDRGRNKYSFQFDETNIFLLSYNSTNILIFRIHFFSVSRWAVDFLILVFVIFFCSL